MTKGFTSRLTILCLLAAFALPVTAADQPEISSAWARATPPGATVGAVYLALQGGDKDDRLIGASTDRARSVELHTVEEIDGVARMRPLESLEVPAGTRVELAPGGHHLMLMGLSSPLVAGESLSVVFKFENSAAQRIEVPIKPVTQLDDSTHHHHSP
jgi:copper(I)-binding protein